ncbi:hypothetical protein PQX77_002241 [Marasmius sp. AFHP31]|nr:hypothetical protein PQX77_002241 [Marasmius sp. AFHP31]
MTTPSPVPLSSSIVPTAPIISEPASAPSTTLTASPASTAASLPRPYETADLRGLNKVKLANLVLRQGHLWPVPPGKKFTETYIKRDVNKDALIAGLLDKTLGFTTCEPRQSPRPNAIHSSAPHATLNNSIPPATEPVAPPTRETTTSLTVFVNDLRTTTASGKGRGQVANVMVPCVLSTSLPAIPIQILAKDVMRELQNTNAAIRGNRTVTVSQQHSQYAEYEVTFATAFNPNDVEGTVYSPETLEFPPRGHLFLDVDSRSEEPEGSDRQALPSAQVPEETSSTTHRSVPRVRTEVIEWLQRELGERAGYEDFKNAHHHALQNPDIVKRWQFMSDFANEYKKKRPKSSVVSIHQSRTLRRWLTLLQKERFPTQEELARALGYSSSTTLKNALSAYRLIEDYREKGVQRVIEEIEKIEDPPSGSIVLFKFLRGFIE